MRKLYFLLLVLAIAESSAISQNVFNPADTTVRYDSTKPLGSIWRPSQTRTGLQKWVSVPTNGISSSYDASSYKAYYINVLNKRMAFRLKFPKSYTNPDSINKRYPIMMFFHGAGEPGCPSNGGIYNNEKQLLHGGKLFMDRVDNNEFDGFLFYPQAVVNECSNYWGTAYDAVILAALDSMIKYIRVDIDRLFVNGLSDGGRTTWRFARSWPMRVARVAPSAMYAGTTNHTSMIHIPVWFATGGRDTNPSPEQAQETLTTFTAQGGNIRYTLFPTLGHGVWNQHWAEPDYVPFMNGTHKANPLVYNMRYEWCPGQPISARMGLTPGFSQYEWSRDNVVIARRANGVNTILSTTHVASFTGNEIVVKSYGTYRARFRRTATGAWSAWSPTPAVLTTKAITQTDSIRITGVNTKLLPTPDGSTTVPLEMKDGFLNYQWYRVSDNVLVSSQRTYNAPVGVYRGRYSEQYGCGTNFSPDFTVINANGNPKPDPAFNLVAVPVSTTQVQLTWENVPSPSVNETAFEIYRGSAPGVLDTLIAIVPADTLSYRDRNLVANNPYYYVVRAVTTTGAAAISNEAASKTTKDVTPPSVPSALEYRGSTQNSVALRWNSSSGSPSRYDIYVNGTKMYSSTSNSFTVRNLDSLKNYAFTVKSIDAAGNASAPSAQLVAYTHRQGLNFKYYNGTFSALPNFSTLTPVKTGIIDSVNTAVKIRTQADNYAVLWEGYIYIPVTATYTFETNSDEGSKIWIDVPYSAGATPVVNNDGIHTPQAATGTITLAKGYHSIAVAYFERTGTETMELWWSNDAGITRRRLIDNFFAYVPADNAPPLVAPASLAATALSYNKIKLTWADLSDDETGFEIVRSTTVDGTYTSVGTVGVNKTTFTDSALNSSTSYYYKVRAAGPLSESPYTDPAFDVTPAAPGTPVAPTDLTADNISPSYIVLNWRDNSGIETNYQLWRSTDNGASFQTIATLAANSNLYRDNAVTAFAEYQYYVMGINGAGNGAPSDTITVIAGNNAPIVGTIADITVKTDATVNRDFTVSDPGDQVTVTVINKPSFINLQNLGGGTYRLVVSPTVNSLGWYSLEASVKDSKGAVTTIPFKVSVLDKNTRSVFVNFGTDVAPTPWTNWPGVKAANAAITNLRDENNAVTPFGITMTTAWAFQTQLGHITGNNTGAVPDSVLRSGIGDSLTTARTILFSGLNPAMRYNIVFVGSQNEGINSTTEYSIGTQRDTLINRYNTNQTANLNSLTPTSTGQLTVSVRRLAGANYLNGLIIEEYAPAITLLNPVNLYVEAVDRTTINVSWSDRTNNEAVAGGYELTRATDSLFSSIEAVIALPGNATSYRNTGLTPNKKYWYRVRAKSGANFSGFSNFAKTITPANRVLVDFNVTLPDAPAPWNMWNESPDDFQTFNGVLNQNSVNSGINLRIEQIFNGEFTAGMVTGNNSGPVPDNVLRSNWWIDKTQLAQIRVTGLNQTRRYRFGFVGSSGPNGWYKDNYTATYTINGRTVYLNSWGNNSKVVYIGDVEPNEAGEVLLNFSTTQAAAYVFNAGLIIEDYSDPQGGSALNSVLEQQPLLTETIAEDLNKRTHIYPNPFTDGLNIDLYNSAAANKVDAEIYDVTGRIIFRRQYSNLPAGINTLRFDPGSATLKPGMYIMMVRVNGEIMQTKKLMKVLK